MRFFSFSLFFSFFVYIQAMASCLEQGENSFAYIDTAKWFPEEFHIIYPDKQLTLKLPFEKDQSGVRNLLFQSQKSGIIYLLDTVIRIYAYNARHYTKFSEEKYDVILLYNNGKYIKYNDVILKKGTSIELDMRNLILQSKDSVSQQWLSLRAFNDVVDFQSQRDINIQKLGTAISDSAIHIRGYLFPEDEMACTGPLISIGSGMSMRGIIMQSGDGFFEFELYDISQPIKFSCTIRYLQPEITVTVNCGLFIILEESPFGKENKIIRYGSSEINNQQ